MVDLARRTLLLGAFPAACGLAATDAAAQAQPVVDAADFGASPTASARTNSRAFRAASDAVMRNNGGTLLVRPGTYQVGYQDLSRRRGAGAAYRALDIIHIVHCRRPVVISGQGATLRAVNGTRFGAFDPVTGRAMASRAGFVSPDHQGHAYRMIYAGDNRGPVVIEGFELDGNLRNYVVGGEYGDTGRQLIAMGIMLAGNLGPVTVRDIRSHHHGLDGIHVDHKGLTPASPRYPVTIEDSEFDSNGRQGLSWVGGTELNVFRCRFSRTGKAGLLSAPGAGVDCEAELSVCRNGRFVDCVFSDNAGVGFLAEAGDVAGIRLERCTFIGTTAWSCWPRKPFIRMSDCRFIGSITNVWGDPDPRRATRFDRCRFTADAKLSPTREVYGQYLADLGAGARNVVMANCEFKALLPDKALPWTLPDLVWQDCEFEQTGAGASYPRGIFRGNNRISSRGLVGLDGSRFDDPILLNGRRFP